MSLSATSSAATSSVTRTAAGVAFAGGAGSLVVLLALHGLRPDLAPGGHVMSEYAIGYAPAGLAFFVLQSLGCLAMAIALAGFASTIRVRIGVALLLFAALGLGLAVAFPMDPLTTPAGQETLSGTMHGVAALIGIPGFIAATLVLGYALPKQAPWASSSRWLIGLAHVTWIALALMVACMVLLLTQGVTAMGDVVGWANRLLVLAYAFWLMVAAWPLLKPAR